MSRPKGRGKTAREAAKQGFKHVGKTPYLWGGDTWGGIDCSHFVCKCFEMGYLTTGSMNTASSPLADRDFTFHPYSIGPKPGDIVVWREGDSGHTGFVAKNDAGIIGILQSGGRGDGVNFDTGMGGAAWQWIWRPKEGWGIYPVKFTPQKIAPPS